MTESKNFVKDDDRQLVNYLLGVLPEEEVERLDEASIVDDDVAARLCDVENDLIDAYVTETLEHDTRDRFEARYLKWPSRREKVRFAKRFLTAVDRTPAPSVVAVSVASSPAVSVASSGFERIRRFSPKADVSTPVARRATHSWPLLTAAASLLLACGVLVNDLQLREGLNQAQRLGAAQDRRADTLTHELDQARRENVEIAQALERARAAAASGDQPSVSASLAAAVATAYGGMKALVLFPQTRSIGQVPKINVAPHADGVIFELRLESNEFPQYRALLKDSGTNRIIWRSAVLHARSEAPTSVSLVVPANVLESRHYSFELAGIDEAGHQTTTGNYAVQIDRR